MAKPVKETPPVDVQEKALDDAEKNDKTAQELAEVKADRDRLKAENEKLKQVNNRLYARAVASTKEEDPEDDEDEGVTLDDIVADFMKGGKKNGKQ